MVKNEEKKIPVGRIFVRRKDDFSFVLSREEDDSFLDTP